MVWDPFQFEDLLWVQSDFGDGNYGKLLVNFLGYNKLWDFVESPSM